LKYLGQGKHLDARYDGRKVSGLAMADAVAIKASGAKLLIDWILALNKRADR